MFKQKDFYVTKIVSYCIISMIAFYAVGFVSGYVQASQRLGSSLVALVVISCSLLTMYVFGRKALHWFLGLLGEYRVNSILESMNDRGFDSIWGVKINGENGDLDHIAVGPTGVWVIETKNSDGIINFDEGTLTRNGVPYPGEPLSKTYRKSKVVERYLAGNGLSVSVYPALVFAGNFAKVRFGLNAQSGVHVIGYSWIPKLLESGKPILSEEQVKEVFGVLQKLEHRR
jgi:hypothetical protein